MDKTALWITFWTLWMMTGLFVVLVVVFLMRYSEWKRKGFDERLLEFYEILKDNDKKALKRKVELAKEFGVSLSLKEAEFPAVAKVFDKIALEVLEKAKKR